MNKIVVLGSSNTDLVVRTGRMPLPGETLLGEQFMMTAGGKGANQAVAVARLGDGVTFIAKVGRDMFGDSSVAGYEKEGIYTRTLTKTIDGVTYTLRPESHMWIFPYPAKVLQNPGNNPIVQTVNK